MFWFLRRKKVNIPPAGCIESPLDKRDVLTSEIIPEIKRIPKECPAPFDLDVLDQNGKPFCVGYTGAAKKQENEMRERKSIVFDGDWLYRECKKIDNYDGPGTYLRALLKVLQKVGAKPLNGTEEDAGKYKIGGYAKVEPLTFEEIKKVIFVNGAIIAGFIGSNGGWQTAYIRPPKPGERTWGHATLLPAYCEQFIDGQNSWGKDWGDNGKFYVPQNYLPFEAWAVLTDLPSEFLIPTKLEGFVAQEYLRTDKYLIGQEVYPYTRLNLRKEPNGEKILTLDKGQRCIILSEPQKVGNYNWVRVKIKT